MTKATVDDLTQEEADEESRIRVTRAIRRFGCVIDVAGTVRYDRESRDVVIDGWTIRDPREPNGGTLGEAWKRRLMAFILKDIKTPRFS